jgi:hypothetical protein
LAKIAGALVNSAFKNDHARIGCRYNGGDFGANSRDAMMSNALAAQRPIDRSMADEWTTYIQEDRLEPIREVFRKEGADGPVVMWNPDASEMAAEPLQVLLEYWSTVRSRGALPLADTVDPLAMRRALGHVMLIDVVENGQDFRYRLFGSAIAAVSGFDMTGRLLSGHPASAYLREFSLAFYRSTVLQGRSAFSRYALTGTTATAQWHRVALPLADRSGQTVRLLAGTVPLARDGRIVPSRF